MWALGHDWCAVCRQKIRQVLGPFRPTPPIYEIFERLEVLLRRIRIDDWVVDPAPFDLSRFARLGQVARPVEDELSSLLVRVETMSADELRASLVQVRSQLARLEAAAAVIEAGLQSKR
jgi:hypothetical protein